MVKATHSAVNRRKRTGSLLLAVSTLCWGQIAAGAPRDEVRSRGFQHTSQDRDLVEKSIGRANDALASSGLRFVPSWNMRKGDRGQHGVVPVYLVEPPQNTATTPAAVPEGCYCVFVNPSFLASWIAFNSQGTGRLALDRGPFLTFVLLHEAGHIKNNTAAAAFKDGEMHELNIDPSIAKRNEVHADEFAANQLKTLARQPTATMASIGANAVINELVKLSWNMQAFRSLDEFGSFAIGKPSVFFDLDYTHPNMAWRILKTNDLLIGSEATRSSLQAFEEARQRGTNPEPLFERR